MSAGRKGLIDEWLTEDGLAQIEGWARDGLTDKDIYNNIGIRSSTFYKWKSEHSEIAEALKKGKAPVDIKVENALLKRALGYEYTEVTTEIRKMPDGGKQEHIRKITREVQPDVTAIIYWLQNRRPDKWRDKRNVNLTTNPNGKLAELIDGLQEPPKNDSEPDTE